jgi:hypothetical protein
MLNTSVSTAESTDKTKDISSSSTTALPSSISTPTESKASPAQTLPSISIPLSTSTVEVAQPPGQPDVSREFIPLLKKLLSQKENSGQEVASMPLEEGKACSETNTKTVQGKVKTKTVTYSTTKTLFKKYSTSDHSAGSISKPKTVTNTVYAYKNRPMCLIRRKGSNGAKRSGIPQCDGDSDDVFITTVYVCQSEAVKR